MYELPDTYMDLRKQLPLRVTEAMDMDATALGKNQEVYE